MSNLPDITLDNADVTAEQKRTFKKLREGQMPAKCVGQKVYVNDKGNIVARLHFAPVDETGAVQKSGTATLFLAFPFNNPDVTGHKTPGTSWTWYRYLRATEGYDSLPDAVKRKEGAEKIWVTPDGREITDYQEVIACNNAMLKKHLAPRLMALYKNPTEFLDHNAIIVVERKGDYCNVKFVNGTPNDELELITDDFFEETESEDTSSDIL